MMETRENDLAHSLLMVIRVFAELCIFFVLLGLILACSAGVFSRFGRANGFACESAMLRFLSPIFLCHKIKDGGYNNTNMNKLSPTQNTPAVQATWGAEPKTFLSDARQPEVDLFHSREEV